jgi:hypothetical protein
LGWIFDTSCDGGAARAATPSQEGPSITISSPVAGTVWLTENINPISYAMSSPSGVQANKTALFYSRNSGASYTMIAADQPTNETYSWTAPATLESASMEIKVVGRDGFGQLGTKESGVFLMDAYPPTVEVIQPVGGETIGGTYLIRWGASDTLGLPALPISLYYSTDSGSNWSLITAGIANTGSYNWTISAPNSDKARIKVTVRDLASRESSARSAGDFTIEQNAPTVVSVAPADGATNVQPTTEVIVAFSKAMSRQTVQDVFALTGTATVSGTFSWSSDSKQVNFKPSTFLARNATYTVAIGGSAADSTGISLGTGFSSAFTTAKENLTIVIKANNAAIQNNDYIPARPSFRASVTNDISIEPTSLKLYVDGSPVLPFTVANSPLDYVMIYQPAGELEDESVMKHTVSAEAQDISGTRAGKTISGLKVTAKGSGAGLVGAASVYPATFSVARDKEATIAYNLNQDGDIQFIIFSSSGEPIWSRRFASGTNGAMAGYNAVVFNGLSDTAGTALGNGIYAFRIISGGKVIGKGHIVIYD